MFAKHSSSILRIYIACLIGAVAVLVVGGLALEEMGTSFPDSAHPVEIWGTVAEWGSALLPTIAIVATVDLWRRERAIDAAKSASERLATAFAAMRVVVLEHRVGGSTFLLNGTSETVALREDRTIGVKAMDFKAGEEGLVSETPIEAVCVRAMGLLWRISIGATPAIVADPSVKAE